MVDLTKLSDDELRSIASGNLKDLPEETLRLISGAKAPTGSAPPIGMDAVPAIEKQFANEFEQGKATLRKDYENEKEEITTTSPFTLPGFLSSPPAVVTGVGLLALGTGYAAGRYGPQAIDKAKGAYKSVKERFMASPVDAPVRIEPIGFESFADMTPTTTLDANPLGQTNLTPEDIQARAAQLKAAETPPAPGPIARTPLPTGAVNPELFSSSPKAPVPPGVPPQFPPEATFSGLGVPPSPPYQPSTPFSAAPPGAPAPEPSANPNSSTTSIVNNTVKEMIDEVDNSPPEMRTGAASQAATEAANKPVPPVYPKAGTKFKSEADIPPGFVARYDVGNLDRSMGNILGLEHRANARDLFSQGKPFGQSANLNQDVSDLTKKYFQQLQSEIPETLLGRDARQAQKIPSEFGVFGKNTNFGRGVTVGGRAATIFAAADVANAAQQGNYGGAALQAADIATDYLPFVGQVKQALSPSSAGEGSTLSPQIVAQQKAYMDNLYRLGGGPLANTEAGERFRRNEEVTRRIAGRTGAAVPPQFRR